MAAKARTLKSAAREKVLAKYHRRGNNRSNIWLYYSPKTHVEWVLASDLEFDHAVLLEASLDVVRFDLNPNAIIVKVGDDDQSAQFDAIVWFRERGPEARDVKSTAEDKATTDVRTIHQRRAQETAALQMGANRRVMTGEDLAPFEMLIVNWRRVIAFMSATRDIPMGDANEAAALKLHAKPDTTIEALLADVPEEEKSTYLAAVFSLHQQGHYASDLDRFPLSRSTRFWRKEVQS